MLPLDDLVETWCARDHAAAFLAADHAVIDATRGPRSLIVERIRARGPHTDLFHACAVLGRLIADRGGSPTLAASAIDGAAALLPELDAETARAARAALTEGFVAARAEAASAVAVERWEYPGCVVPLESATVAIAAGYPDDDVDALSGWAARVASAVARAGYRRAVLGGGERACAALSDALELAGVKVRTTAPPAPVGGAR
jgi:hypothetical protein